MVKDESIYAYPLYSENQHETNAGMFLRDYFAGQALAGLLASNCTTDRPKALGSACYSAADYLLEARNAKEE